MAHDQNSNTNIKEKMIPMKTPDSLLLKMGLPRVVAAFVDVGMGPVTVTVYNGATKPVKVSVVVMVVVPFSTVRSI
jgi:hypothetical protein